MNGRRGSRNCKEYIESKKDDKKESRGSHNGCERQGAERKGKECGPKTSKRRMQGPASSVADPRKKKKQSVVFCKRDKAGVEGGTER